MCELNQIKPCSLFEKCTWTSVASFELDGIVILGATAEHE
jgi:hypothetical protein